MPWECKHCNELNVADEVKACSRCKKEKLDWTLAGGATRKFSVKARPVELLFGPGRDPRPRAEGWPDGELSGAERVVSVPRATAAAWSPAQLPPEDRVLVVRCFTTADTAEVQVAVEYQGGRADGPAIVSAPRRAPVKGRPCCEARLLFVHGPPDAPGLAFDGVTVVDTRDDDTGAVHAPRVGVSAMGASRRTVLPVDVHDEEKGWARRLQCEGIQFNTDSHLMRPTAEGLPVLQLVLRHLFDHPDDRLVIAGHTDAAGDEARNLELGRLRGEHLRLILEGEADAWADSALASYVWLTEGRETPIDSDEEDVEAVQTWVRERTGLEPEEALGRRGWSDASTWRALYDLYEAALAEEVELFNDALPDEAPRPRLGTRGEAGTLRGSLRWVDDAHQVVPCAARYPKVDVAAHRISTDDAVNAREETNRRDEFLFFDAARPPWTPADALDDEGRRVALYGAPGPAWDYQTADGPWTWDALDCCPPVEDSIVTPREHVLFLIDASPSMHDDDPQRMPECKEVVRRAIRALPPATTFGVWCFRTDAWKWTPCANGLVPATAAHKRDAIRWVRSLDPMSTSFGGGGPGTHAPMPTSVYAFEPGETHLHEACMHALAAGGVRAVALFSDGLPTFGLVNEVEILKVVTAANGGAATIDAYGFLGLWKDPRRAKPPAWTKYEVPEARRRDAIDRYQALLKAVSPTIGYDDKRRDVFFQLYDWLRTGPSKDEAPFKTWTAWAKWSDVPALDRGGIVSALSQALLGWFLNELATGNGGEFKEVRAELLRRGIRVRTST